MPLPPQATLPGMALTERWRITHRAKGWDRGFTETVVLGSRILFVEETGRDKGAYGALDVTTGRRLWSRPFVPEVTNEILAQGPYATVAGEHRILVFDPRDGRVVWQGRREGFGGGPTIAGNRLFAELKRNVLSAIDLPTRRVLWNVRSPLPFVERTNFGHLVAVGASLWMDSPHGNVRSLAQEDGHAFLSKSFPDGKVFNFLPLRDGVVVSGDRTSELWTLPNARRVWRRSLVDGYGTFLFQPLTGEIWEMPNEGRLVRVDARNGRGLSDAQVLPGKRGGAFEPTAYRNGALAYNGHLLVRVDPQGRPVSQFDPQESIYDLHPRGDYLFIRSNNGLVLLSPGTKSLPKDKAALATRLVAKPSLMPEDRRTLLALDRDALPALFAAVPRAPGEDKDVLVELLTRIADRRDTERMLDFSRQQGVFSGYGVPVRLLSDWLMAKADPAVLASRLLPQLKAAHDKGTQATLVPYLLRSPDPSVVDEMLRLLRASDTDKGVKALIYGGIAASARDDVLDEILRIRAQGRRLEAPNPELTIKGDYDRDGIPDDLDANPFVSPHPLTEIQQVLFALFDTRFRFDDRNGVLGIVDYGRGVDPFELVGWRGALVPEELTGTLSKQGVYAERDPLFGSIRFEPQNSTGTTVEFNVDHTEATAGVGIWYGSLDGMGYSAQLRKMRGEWFVVSLKMPWIS